MHIIATTRGEQSRTLSISKEFLQTLKEKHPYVKVDELDEQTLESWKKVSALAENFISYDLFLITSPM